MLSIHRTAAPLSADEECAAPGTVFKECDQCPEMVVVPAGSFMMGSPRGEGERFFSESPQHQVTFAYQFAVGRFAVTFDEWAACVADGGCTDEPSDEGWGRGRRPVINVTWNDAKKYLAWLSRKTGKTYRLLSEAEREYVTRAGTTTPFWWGASISTNQANYNGHHTYGAGLKGEYRAKTVPVDTFTPNPWGLYQVHGNVEEWTEDCFHDNYENAPTNGSAWTSGDCKRRVQRGGAWWGDPGRLRSAYRHGWSADTSSISYGPPNVLRISFGFRVARTLAAP